MGNYIDRISSDLKTNPIGFETQRRQEWRNQVDTEIVYELNTVSQASRIAFTCLAIIIFPIGLGILAHRLVGKIMFCGWKDVNEERKDFIKSFCGKKSDPIQPAIVMAKRINLLVDGLIVDAFICGKPENINNGKWTLVATGVGRCMEDIHDKFFTGLAAYEQNYLFFNYAGVGGSDGLPSKDRIVNAYSAALHFLEDSQVGIGAKEITCLGRSIGAGVQGEALKNHTFQPQIKYTSIRDRSFSRLSDVAWYTKILKLGWEFNGVSASKKLEKLGIDEIILQTAHHRPSRFTKEEDLTEIERLKNVDLYHNGADPLTADKIMDDGTISQESSLAHALLSKKTDWKHKKFISVSSDQGHYGLPSFALWKKMGLAN